MAENDSLHSEQADAKPKRPEPHAAGVGRRVTTTTAMASIAATITIMTTQATRAPNIA